MPNSLLIYGASGHGKVLHTIAKENNITVPFFIDDDKTINHFMGIPVIHSNNFISNINLIIGIGNNKSRKDISIRLTMNNYKTLISKMSTLNEYASVGAGTCVMAGSVIQGFAEIGNHVIINTCASIDHDCKIHDFVHLSPGVRLAGGVEVGEGSHIGINATIIQNIKIGKWCTIGAGSVILKDIPDFAVVVGNPGKIIKFNHEYEN